MTLMPHLIVPLPVYVSKPKISFSIAKEGDDYQGNVTCLSSRGTPPANFSLLLDEREVGSVTASDSLTAWFPISIVPGLDMGAAQCKVNTEVQELTSEPVTVVVGRSYTSVTETPFYARLSFYSLTVFSFCSLFVQCQSEVM